MREIGFCQLGLLRSLDGKIILKSCLGVSRLSGQAHQTRALFFSSYHHSVGSSPSLDHYCFVLWLTLKIVQFMSRLLCHARKRTQFHSLLSNLVNVYKVLHRLVSEFMKTSKPV